MDDDRHMREFERIVEFSYQKKTKHFVVRFLEGQTYKLSLEDLPPKLLTKQPEWQEASLSDDRTSIQATCSDGEIKTIPYHIIHANGTLVQ